MEAAKLESTPTPDEVSRESQQCDQSICSEKPLTGDQNGLEKQQSNDQNGTEKRLKVSNRRSASNLEEIPSQLTASMLFEYRWPPHSSDKFMIQEQIADYLDVKSFKRKYPDLTRREVDGDEKDFVRQHGVVSQTLYNMGITALRVEEVLDLMAQDYTEKLAEYQKAVAERTKLEMAAKQIEYQAIKADSQRLAELRRKAIRSTFDWNSEMNKDRKNERPCFFEEQTMLIHYPKKKLKFTNTNYGSYPVALINGQYQNYYRHFTSSELNFLPVNSVMDSEPFLPQRPCYSPEPIRVDESDLHPKHEEKPVKEKTKSERRGSKASSMLAHSERSSAEEHVKNELNEHCAFCIEDIKPTDRFVQCTKCGSCGHPACMEMSDEMFVVIKSYPWMCMECKPCSICSNLDGEDKMMFCDRCDRGYHTFCVGLNDLPSGRWICPKFCRKTTGGSDTPARNSDQGSRSSTPLELNKCTECGEIVSKEQLKSARRNRQRKRNLCENCSLLKKK